MPVISVKLAGELTREQKKEIVERFTATMEEVAGKPRDYVVVSFESQPYENWGWGGKLLDEE
jgi:4-oxalocrotonate tautomerase